MSKFLWWSHFSGGGGSTLGAMQNNFIPILGIENSENIAKMYKNNIGNVICKDISEVSCIEVKKYVPIVRKNNEILVVQTSPPCQEYSIANKNANPDSIRGTILEKTFKFYAIFKPEYVILENVPGYLKSKGYIKFKEFLSSLEYNLSFEKVINCADFGVPQTRRRLIAIWNKYNMPSINLTPTHTKEEWIGWHESISDLIPSLRDATLTEKQRKSLELNLKNYSKGFLVDADNSQSTKNGYKTREDKDPGFTITKSQSYPKAVIIERIGYRESPKILNPNDPLWTLRATLADDQKGGTRNNWVDVVLSDSIIKSLDVRCLARLQSFPDDYKFSGKVKDDVTVIGNSVPPKLMYEICHQIKNICGNIFDVDITVV